MHRNVGFYHSYFLFHIIIIIKIIIIIINISLLTYSKQISIYKLKVKEHLISRDLLKQRHIKNQERFIARRFGVIVTPLSRD